MKVKMNLYGIDQGLDEAFRTLEHGGSIIAQVYPDGLAVACLSPDVSKKLSELLPLVGFKKPDNADYANRLDERFSEDEPPIASGLDRTTGGEIGQP